MEVSQSASRGLFSAMTKFKLGKLANMQTTKIQSHAALIKLQSFFKTDLEHIISEIKEFRQGLKSLEVFAEQQKMN